MEEQVDSDVQSMMMEGGMQIDPRKERFPCCIVWTSIPVISWLIPFIGHIGICRQDGVILDFAAPNFVSVDDFAFGAVARYIQINKDKECCISCHSSSLKGDEEYLHNNPMREALTWDSALQKGTEEFQQQSYSLFACNCHSFVANNLNRLGFRSGRWNVVNLAVLIFLNGRWVSKTACLRSYLPFVLVSSLGIAFGGTTYLSFLAFFASLLVGWFLLGTYWFKNLIYV